MTPGIQRGPPFPSKAKKNAIVAIASLEKPSVPMVVGICEIDVASLREVQGVKGHAVRGEHWDGDEIWAWSSGGKSGAITPEKIEGWDLEDINAILPEDVEQLELDDHEDDGEEGGVALDQVVNKKTKIEPHNEYVEGEDAQPFERVEDKELSTKGEWSSPPSTLRSSLYNAQKSTNVFGTHSCMVSSIIAIHIGAIRMMV